MSWPTRLVINFQFKTVVIMKLKGKVAKIGKATVVVFDKAMFEKSGLKVGDLVSLAGIKKL